MADHSKILISFIYLFNPLYKMDNIKNVSLDSLAIASFASGITFISNNDLVVGGVLILVGIIISGVKYFTRK